MRQRQHTAIRVWVEHACGNAAGKNRKRKARVQRQREEEEHNRRSLISHCLVRRLTEMDRAYEEIEEDKRMRTTRQREEAKAEPKRERGGKPRDRTEHE